MVILLTSVILFNSAILLQPPWENILDGFSMFYSLESNWSCCSSCWHSLQKQIFDHWFSYWLLKLTKEMVLSRKVCLAYSWLCFLFGVISFLSFFSAQCLVPLCVCVCVRVHLPVCVTYSTGWVSFVELDKHCCRFSAAYHWPCRAFTLSVRIMYLLCEEII